jgi:ABC-type Zn uptake system ZnuABC Zn-binding protein ZnuA
MSFGRHPLRLDITRTAVALAFIGAFVAACSTPASSGAPDGALRVVATTTVLADLVKQVGGDDVSVTSLVPKGGEVHTFDPTPSDLQGLTSADLIVMNGLGLDDWLAGIATDSGATAIVVELAEGLEGVTYLAGEAHADDEAVNPHLWLNVAYASKYVDRIIETLSDMDPEIADGVGARGEAYLARLAELDTSTRDRIGEIPEADRVIVSFHEAFPYFAAAYGLTVVGTIVDAPGQDPSAGEIAALVEAIRASGAKAVFGEAQFSPDLAEIVADEAGVAVETHLYSDSLGDAPADTYEGMMRWNVDRVVGALGG